MADDVEVRIDSEKLAEAMRKAPFALYQSLHRRVTAYLLKWVKQWRRATIGRGKKVETRSGALGRAFGATVHGDGRDVDSLVWISGTVFAELPYPRILEYGGTIRPVHKQWLTIPLGANKTRAGVSRASASYTGAESGYFGPSTAFQEGTFFIRSKAGNLLLVKDAPGTQSGFEPMFVLKKSVTIPAKLGFNDAFKKQTPKLVRTVNGAIGEALEAVTSA